MLSRPRSPPTSRFLIDADIGADKNPGGSGVWELPGLGQSQPAFGGRYQP
jgi:acetolactate synthase I/II/III large subunit